MHALLQIEHPQSEAIVRVHASYCSGRTQVTPEVDHHVAQLAR
jgi:hypothetical protein